MDFYICPVNANKETISHIRNIMGIIAQTLKHLQSEFFINDPLLDTIISSCHIPRPTPLLLNCKVPNTVFALAPQLTNLWYLLQGKFYIAPRILWSIPEIRHGKVPHNVSTTVQQLLKFLMFVAGKHIAHTLLPTQEHCNLIKDS